MKNLLRKTSVRVSLVIFAAFWTLLAVLFYASYRAAFAHLEANKPTEMQNRFELQMFYAPLNLQTGEEFSAADLNEYFGELGYDFSENQTAGSFSATKNSVRFFPRSNVFPNGEIQFEKNRVS